MALRAAEERQRLKVPANTFGKRTDIAGREDTRPNLVRDFTKRRQVRH